MVSSKCLLLSIFNWWCLNKIFLHETPAYGLKEENHKLPELKGALDTVTDTA